MDNVPPEKLRDLIAKHGRSIVDDPRRCEGLLRDACGSYKREIHVLMSALNARVASDLTDTGSFVPSAALYDRLTTRLNDELAMSSEAARWAVESWAFALGLLDVSPSEVSSVSHHPQFQEISTYEDPSSGLIRTFVGHCDYINSVAFSPDGRTILSGSADRSIKFWDASLGEIIWSIEEAAPVHCVAISPDGRHCITGSWPEYRDGGDNTERLSDGLLAVREMAGGKVVRKLGSNHLFQMASFSCDGRYAAADTHWCGVTIWKLPQYKFVHTIDSDEVSP